MDIFSDYSSEYQSVLLTFNQIIFHWKMIAGFPSTTTQIFMDNYDKLII